MWFLSQYKQNASEAGVELTHLSQHRGHLLGVRGQSSPGSFQCVTPPAERVGGLVGLGPNLLGLS